MSFLYNLTKKEIMDGTIDLINDTLKMMLVTSSYVADPDHDVVDAGGANDPVDHELSGTGYVAGWGGAGRLAITGKSIVEDDVNDRAEFQSSVNLTWSGINAGTAAAAIIIKEGGANDTTSRLIAYIDTGGFPITTNGGDLNLNWNAEGIFQF